MKWDSLFKELEKNKYMKDLYAFLDKEYENTLVYPIKEKIWDAFKLTTLENLKVVILGQDPYHDKGQAMGLAFSVPKECPLPPSLKNIYKEICYEYGSNMPHDGDLTYLAKQGVLLLNVNLTVRAHKPLSHKIKEYDLLAKDIILFLDSLEQPIVFMFWGGFAKKYTKLVNNQNHLVLTASHPSPLSANKGGWFGNNHFLQANKYLKMHGIDIITWTK